MKIRKRIYSTPNSGIDKSALKKAKHREIDANRRARESAAVMRLSLLTSDDRSIAGQYAAQKRDKVTTLELAADKIESLQNQVEKFSTQLANEKEKNIRLTELIKKIKSSNENQIKDSNNLIHNVFLNLLPYPNNISHRLLFDRASFCV